MSGDRVYMTVKSFAMTIDFGGARQSSHQVSTAVGNWRIIDLPYWMHLSCAAMPIALVAECNMTSYPGSLSQNCVPKTIFARAVRLAE